MAVSTSIRAVVFDMGGVLVELGPLTDILGDDPLPTDEFWAGWLASPTVREFEMGRCSPESFGRQLVEEMSLSFSGDDLVERFLAWPKGLYPGAAELVTTLRADTDLVVAVLSNTNELHWQHQRDSAQMRSLFDQTFLSYELGLAKPDREIFERVVTDLDVAAEQILFLDDNQINVDGARSVGMRAELTRGLSAARSALQAHGLC